MSESRLVKPDAVRLELSRGDSILIKRELTAGDVRRLNGRIIKPAPIDQKPLIDLTLAEVSELAEYLLDWSLVDLQGKPIDINGQPADVVIAALDAIDQDSYREIRDAIHAHQRAELEKKTRPALTGATP